QGAKLLWFGFPQVTAEKSWRRQKKGEFVLLNQRGVFRDLKRIGISHDADAFDHRIPERDGRSEAVKKRERSENGVFLFRVEQFAKLGNVADDVAMRENDAFRIARAAAGKKQDGFVMTAAFWNLEHAQQQSCRSEDRHHPPEKNLRFQSW